MNNTDCIFITSFYEHEYGADCRRGRVVDSGPRGSGFNPQPGRLSLWPLASHISTTPQEMVRN